MTRQDPAELFGARIRRERTRRGWSCAELAAKAGVGSGHNAVSRIENAAGEPGLFRAAAIAAALGLSLDALLAPADCGTCDGLPPAGFTCQACGKAGDAP